MKNFIHTLRNIYEPTTAIIIRKSAETQDIYVEEMMINRQGRMHNARPMPLEELGEIGTILSQHGRKSSAYLPENILSPTILVLSDGGAIWYTKAGLRHLLFSENLSCQSGNYPVPALLWVAEGHSLQIFALPDDNRPTIDTILYHAPFHNVNGNGGVCMGSAGIDLDSCPALEQTIDMWASHFFGSYFTHANRPSHGVKDPITPLWQSISPDSPVFPHDQLEPTHVTIKQLL